VAGRPYTERILSVITTGVWVGYRVPTGYRAVVRSIIAIGATASSGIQVRVAGVLVYIHTFQAAGTYEHADLRATAYAGELVEASISGSSSVVVTAYVFQDTVGRLHSLDDLELRDVEEPSPLPARDG
jgi:hypothetical protein